MEEFRPLTTDEIFDRAYGGYHNKIKDHGVIYCDDGCTQPLFSRRKENGKFVFMAAKVLGFGDCTTENAVQLFEAEYDEITWENSTKGNIDIYAKNSEGWFRYEYTDSKENSEQVNKLCGRKLTLCAEGPFEKIEYFDLYHDMLFEEMENEYRSKGIIDDAMTDDEAQAYDQGFSGVY